MVSGSKGDNDNEDMRKGSNGKGGIMSDSKGNDDSRHRHKVQLE